MAVYRIVAVLISLGILFAQQAEAARRRSCLELIRSVWERAARPRVKVNVTLKISLYTEKSTMELDGILANVLSDREILRQNVAVADLAYILGVDWESFSSNEELALRLCLLSDFKLAGAGLLKKSSPQDFRLQILSTFFRPEVFVRLIQQPFVTAGLPEPNLSDHFNHLVARDLDRRIAESLQSAVGNLDGVEDPKNPFTPLVQEYPETRDLKEISQRLREP